MLALLSWVGLARSLASPPARGGTRTSIPGAETSAPCARSGRHVWFSGATGRRGPRGGGGELAGMITALDHVVIAVRDLDGAASAYEALLGRAPSWRSAAHGGGARIVGFGLANLAVELMAPAGDGPVAGRLAAVLAAQGEGLASLAFAVDDVERAERRLARLGLDPEPIADGESVDASTGARRAWRRTRASAAASHGVRIFLMQQPPAPPSALVAAERAAVAGLDHVVIRTPDPERAA